MAKDLRPRDLPEWLYDDPRESLRKIHQYACDHAENAINWYLSKRKSKRFLGRWSRFLALVLVAVSGALPILALLITDPSDNSKELIEPGWAAILVIFAGGLVAMDRFWGWTSAWVRYMTTGMRIGMALEKYQLGIRVWEASNPGDLSVEQQTASLELARSFISEVDNLVMGETMTWAQEFSDELSRLEESILAVEKKTGKAS